MPSRNTPTPACANSLGQLLVKLLLAALVFLALSGLSAAKEPPEAPSSVASARADAAAVVSPLPIVPPSLHVAESKTMDKKFLALAVVSTGSAFSDSYTTLFARENWLAGKKGVCNVEIQSPYLYGTHPTVTRAYAVATAKSAGSLFAAYYLRKHHSKWWSLPFAVTAITSLQGTTQNMIGCN